ncbi:sensor histidine kinase [Cytobacillus sp. FJAT-54145]|uniref:histidine kinase n=1 Tax=Cytobacillus spartinae TaxID=3299023 RepID=A0ABW6K9I5_9BACI
MKRVKSFTNEHWAYITLFYVRIIWVVLHLILIPYEYKGSNESLYIILLACLIAGVIPQFVWFYTGHKKKWLYPVVELVVTGMFFIYSSYFIGEYFSYIAIPTMCAAATIHTVRLRVPLWIWFSLIPPVAMAIVLPVPTYSISVIEGFFFFGLGCIIWKVIDTQRKMHQLLEENERQRQVLEQYAQQIEKITLLEERNRLSRELHDTVGHTLTSVIMGLDATRYLINDSPEEAIQNIKQLGKISRDGLEDVRRQIHHISPLKEGESLTNELKGIATEFSLSTGTTVTFEAVGNDITVHPQISLTFVRCLQESLTNAKRHGSADNIHILLSVQPELVTLTVQDNGIGMDQIQYGFGLSVMKERIEAYQGKLDIQSHKDKGTKIICQLPFKTGKAG